MWRLQSENPHLEGPQHSNRIIADIFAKSSKYDIKIKTVFSKIDLKRFYMNGRMDDEAEKLMTLTTQWKICRPTFMMFGMSAAPQEWQYFIPLVYCFINDILIATTLESVYKKNLE